MERRETPATATGLERIDPDGLRAVLPEVYEELKGVASRLLARGHPLTWQTTDLVHEGWARLARERRGWSGRPELLVAAAHAMRRALGDHLRRRGALRRGGDRRAAEAVVTVAICDRSFEFVLVEEALVALEARDADAAQVALLKLFGGASVPEMARALDRPVRTVERRWAFARAFLVAVLEEGEHGHG